VLQDECRALNDDSPEIPPLFRRGVSGEYSHSMSSEYSHRPCCSKRCPARPNSAARRPALLQGGSFQARCFRHPVRLFHSSRPRPVQSYRRLLFVAALLWAALRERPTLYELFLEETIKSRSTALVQRFILALTRGGPNGLPRPIEMQARACAVSPCGRTAQCARNSVRRCSGTLAALRRAAPATHAPCLPCARHGAAHGTELRQLAATD
jgi:hypothetical protein